MQKNLFAIYAGILVLGIILGFLLRRSGYEGFVSVSETSCTVCQRKPCACSKPDATAVNGCTTCRKTPCGCGSASASASVDMSKYILKASVPPCASLPDLSNYMLKSECPAPPDMTKYILKSAVPACPPCISTCNKPCKIGECPPCPRTRCPVVQCPDQKPCPPCATVEPPRCPPSDSNQGAGSSCRASSQQLSAGSGDWLVRPLLSTIHDM